MPSSIIHVAGLDLERGHEEDFNRWYEGDHVPHILDRPGWLGLRRYECVDGQPRHLAIYDLSEEALDGPVSEAPYRSGPFGRRIRNYHARTLRRIHEAGEDPGDADLINLVTVDIDTDHAETFSRWYNEVHVPEIVACPGWLGNQRFESIDGEPRFMAIYGLEDEKRPFNSPEFEAAEGWDYHVGNIRGYHGFRIYRHTGAFRSGMNPIGPDDRDPGEGS